MIQAEFIYMCKYLVRWKDYYFSLGAVKRKFNLAA
jgi:hypothetical protein